MSSHVLAYNPILTTITFSTSLKFIGQEAFHGDKALTGLEFTLQDAASIGNNVFHNRDALKTVNLHFDSDVSTYPTIGEQQYMPLIAVDDVTIQTALQAAWSAQADHIILGIPAEFVVSEDGTLTSYTGSDSEVVEIPSRITKIGKNAFANHKEIKELIIPAGVTTYGYRCFSGLSSLGAVTFHGNDFSSLTFLDANGQAITGTAATLSNLFVKSQQHIILTDDATSLASLKKAYSTYTRLGYYLSSEVKKSGDYYLSSDGTTILSYLGDATSPTFPSSVTAIGIHAFEGRNITEVDLSNIVSIDYEGFFETSLTALTLPTSLTSVGESAFASCANLESVAIEGAASIGASAFDSDEALSEFDFGSGAVRLEGGSIWSGCEALEVLNVPKTIDYIQYDAFADYDGTVSCDFTKEYAQEHYSTDEGAFYDGNTNNDVVWAEA